MNNKNLHANRAAMRSAFSQAVSLYRGEWQDTRGCNTKYHDLKHITDCLLAMIHCTDINCDPASVPFDDEIGAQLGKILATADILAQMADRTYLEKLLYLYCELDEAKISEFGDEVDLLHQSEYFYIRMPDRTPPPPFLTDVAMMDEPLYFFGRRSIPQAATSASSPARG
jgi:hypothetical protein